MTARPVHTGLVLGVIGFLGTCVWVTWVIFQSTSSTACIGLIFMPFQALLMGGLFFAFGCCARYAMVAFQPPRRPLLGLLAAGIALALMLPFLYWLGDGLILSYVARDVRSMAPSQIEQFLKTSPYKENKYALNALLEHRDLKPSTLYKIAQIPLPELHERMGSFFPVMGKNTKGFAVMRLVAQHPNADAQTLALLANSPNDAVLCDVAANPNTPQEVLLRLAKKESQSIGYGLAANPNARPAILHALSESGNQYTRANVAGNKSTTPEDLERLAQDPEAIVRDSVMVNANCPPALKKTLNRQFDERTGQRSQ